MTFAVVVVLRTDGVDAWSAPAEAPSAQAQVRERVEARRESLVAACIGDGEAPWPVWVTLQFDAEGAQTALHVVVGEREGADALRACLHRELGFGTRITPPGDPVTVELSLSLP